ncbi:TetR/AcrR family transcriptional regulator [Porticoccaceae bacterium]|nr:TetR/AcrR family transcriptional regulator [Porticoccaceae bacterium]
MPDNETKPIGRPRSLEVDESILNAAADLVSERGYAATSIESIATRAKVGKPAIYRRWNSKAVMMTAVYQHLVPPQELKSDADSFSNEFRHLLKNLFALYRNTSAGQVLAGLIADAQNDPQTMEALMHGVIHERRVILIESVSRGVQRGELSESLNLKEINDLIVAMIWHRLLTECSKLNSAFIENIISTVIAIGGKK